MKLYVDEAGTAPSPRRVRMYLAEKGILVAVERLELPAAVRSPRSASMGARASAAA